MFKNKKKELETETNEELETETNEELQSEFNDDSIIYEDAENIGEDEKNETKDIKTL